MLSRGSRNPAYSQRPSALSLGTLCQNYLSISFKKFCTLGFIPSINFLNHAYYMISFIENLDIQNSYFYKTEWSLLVARDREEREWGEMGFYFGRTVMFYNYTKIRAVEHYEYTKYYWTVDFKIITFMI